MRVVLLVDGKVGATPLDVQAFEYLAGLGATPLVVATKIDKLPAGKRRPAIAGIERAFAGAGGTEVEVDSRLGALREGL